MLALESFVSVEPTRRPICDFLDSDSALRPRVLALKQRVGERVIVGLNCRQPLELIQQQQAVAAQRKALITGVSSARLCSMRTELVGTTALMRFVTSATPSRCTILRRAELVKHSQRI